ncbi:MAG: FAD-dependent oxidoreductase, partial [Candidatus Omnitrophica bacterium]|nr:FAD-dependent oxidoreductase [Candidatus Omnitrophota bacterium]
MNYDLAVIGAGWAGFNAALKARSGGLKVALIDKGQIGGTCLNRGCIPTKTLLQSSKLFSLTKKSKTFGIEAPAASIDFAAIQERKNKIILQLRQGMEFLLKGIDLIREEARLLPGNAIQAGAKKITAASVIIATGSRPFVLPGLGFDGKRIISSDDILELSALPSSLLIVGGGVIGCEFASLFSAFGCPVTIAELT